jgi:CheY-like chemotaxis protein
MSLKLMHHPGRIAVLDDDFSYIEALSLALPADWPLACYAHPQSCIRNLSADRLAWDGRKRRIHDWISVWREGKPLLPHVLQDTLAQAPDFSLTKVLVVDYAMPGKNGLEVLQDLHGLPMQRILLTGMADEQLAVKAFNEGLIEQFIQKHSAEVGQRLKHAIDDLLDWTDVADSQMWRSIFSPAQLNVLQREDVALGLNQLAASRWVEYLVLSEPFGVLGFDAQGRAGWLHLETQDSLRDLAEIAGSQGITAGVTKDLESQRVLVSLEIQQALGAEGIDLTSPAVAIGQSEPLLAAWFDLPSQFARPAAHSYAAYMRMQTREVIG